MGNMQPTAQWISENISEIIDELEAQGLQNEIVEWYLDEYISEGKCEDLLLNGMFDSLVNDLSQKYPEHTKEELLDSQSGYIERTLCQNQPRTILVNFVNRVQVEKLPMFIEGWVLGTIDSVAYEKEQGLHLNTLLD